MVRHVFALALAGTLVGVASMPAASAAEAPPPPSLRWSFSGPFGTFDRGQLQRGFKVYREVCQACHGLTLVSFRNLGEPGGPGFTEAQVRQIASEYQIMDGPDDEGKMFERAGRPADRFPRPWANEAAARAIYNAVPPDLSVIAKARTYERGFPWFLIDIFTQYQEQGVDYLAALLMGYEDKPPADVKIPDGLAYNRYFPGNAIAMAKPFQDGQITYDDGTPQTVEQYARDVSAFLMWAAEPHMEARKRIGLQVMIFLLVLGGLLYFTKKKVWKDAELHPDDVGTAGPRSS